ncbi:MAG: hypothetical protein ACI3ZP_07950 [Candidatus Cryptobacteroides sp.]
MIFRNTKDYVFAMNVVARASIANPNVKIITFALMSNHIHIVAAGEAADIVLWFKHFRKKLSRSLGNGQIPGQGFPDSFRERLKELSDLKALRNVIAYVNRNGYVADPSYTPFSYPWSACGYYYTQNTPQIRFNELDTVTKREMFRGRVPPFTEDTLIATCGIATTDNPTLSRRTSCYIAPPSYCDINIGKSMFRNAHHYFRSVSKDVEAYRDVASEIEEEDFLTDSELFTQICNILREHYQGADFNSITKAQKLDLARTLRYDFRSSNGQIRRLLGLTQYEVDSMFPMRAIR